MCHREFIILENECRDSPWNVFIIASSAGAWIFNSMYKKKLIHTNFCSAHSSLAGVSICCDNDMLHVISAQHLVFLKRYWCTSLLPTPGNWVVFNPGETCGHFSIAAWTDVATPRIIFREGTPVVTLLCSSNLSEGSIAFGSSRPSPPHLFYSFCWAGFSSSKTLLSAPSLVFC